MRIRWYRRILIMMLVFFMSAGGVYCFLEVEKSELKKEVSQEAVSDRLVIPGGMPVGMYMETDGVMILGTGEICTRDGMIRVPAENLVRSGDYIVGIDNESIRNKKELLEFVRNLTNQRVILHLRRNMEYIDVSLRPVMDKAGEYKLGIWVRDNAQGLGTITFLNGDSTFGALGHGIHDVDTNELLEISEGTLYETSIQNIKKGSSGNPGGMEGMIVYNHYNILGTITQNTETGIYGTIDRIDRIFQNRQAVPVAAKEDVKEGEAVIRCAVSGKVEDYKIRITKVDTNPREVNKGIEIQITDEKLLDLTGGIIQGMSGSPILQNGSLVGAVTHVFVQDATKGYGIFSETMLENVD